MFRHRLLVVLLALGTVGGYASGFASLSCRAHARRAAFERHVAHVCAEAAKNPAAAPPTDPYDRW
jgi:hypothetical protein